MAIHGHDGRGSAGKMLRYVGRSDVCGERGERGVQVWQGRGCKETASAAIEVQRVCFIFQTVKKLFFDHMESVANHCPHLFIVYGGFSKNNMVINRKQAVKINTLLYNRWRKSLILIPSNWPRRSSRGNCWAANCDAFEPSCPSNMAYTWISLTLQIMDFREIWKNHYAADQLLPMTPKDCWIWKSWL